MAGKIKYDWSKLKELAKQHNDCEIARIMGINSATVWSARKRLSIKNYKESQSYYPYKLTPQQINKLLALRKKTNLSIHALSEKFNVNHTTIWTIFKKIQTSNAAS